MMCTSQEETPSMSIFYAYCSREIGGWCTPKVTLESPAAIFRYCHVQSALFAEVLVTINRCIPNGPVAQSRLTFLYASTREGRP